MSFSTRILVWLAAGVVTGLLLGDLVAPLSLVATGFVKLLQMTVLPYVVISIIASLGSLSVAEARRLGVRAGIVLVGLWTLGLVFALLMPVVFPTLRQGSFFSTSMLRAAAGLRLRRSLHPVQSVQLAGQQHRPGGGPVLDRAGRGAHLGATQGRAARRACRWPGTWSAGPTKFVVRLTPYGMFAVAAVAAGTLQIEQLARIQVYLRGVRRGRAAAGRCGCCRDWSRR